LNRWYSLPDLLPSTPNADISVKVVAEVDADVNLLIRAQFQDRFSSRHKLLIGRSGLNILRTNLYFRDSQAGHLCIRGSEIRPRHSRNLGRDASGLLTS